MEEEGSQVPDRAPLPADPSLCPELPDDARAALAAGVSQRLPNGLPAAALIALEDHLRLLLAWTAAINLTAVREPVAAVTAHVLDSLAAVPLLRAAGVDVVLDLGSGGGYPGLPLAIALPARHALLVDSTAKKVRFLETAITALGLGGSVGAAAVRAEELAADPRHREAWQAVTARAVASLAELVELSFPLLGVGGMLVAWKRSDLADERVAALPAIAALGGGRLEVHATGPGDHVIVTVTKTGATRASWPRTPTERRRQPWRRSGQGNASARHLIARTGSTPGGV